MKQERKKTYIFIIDHAWKVSVKRATSKNFYFLGKYAFNGSFDGQPAPAISVLPITTCHAKKKPGNQKNENF